MSALPSDTGAAQPQQRLSEQALRRIDREIAKYPQDQRQSAVLAALAIAQDEIGWLPTSTMEEVAGYLQMAPIAVYEVATFYHMFHLAPVGRHKITICTNLPCALSGANAAAQRLQERLGIGFGQTTADGCFTLAEGECMGACGDAPVLLVNNKRMCSFVDASKIDALLESLAAEKDE
ncbi:MAG TPA: NADH-quinone oxidoreductase subunit NuoE [Burkholderiaceae bacterium]|nr:NADH-quinone oxidoreductase subunit NuoE [Burkholderiaceae bacterium]